MTPSYMEISVKFYVGCLISGKGDEGGQFQDGE